MMFQLYVFKDNNDDDGDNANVEFFLKTLNKNLKKL